jgi:hypothetical protein
MWKARILLVATGMAAALLPACAANAGTVTVEATLDQMTVDAKEASLDEILERIGEAEGFRIERVGSASNPGPITARFEGAFHGVLARVLHNESHMIVHSATAKAGIASIVLFGTGAATLPQRVAAARTRSAATASAQPRPLAREVISPSQPQPPLARTRSTMASAQPRPLVPEVIPPAAR